MTEAALVLAVVVLALGASEALGAQRPVDLARLGTPWLATQDQEKSVYVPQLCDGSDTAVNLQTGQAIQVEWREPRDVSSVVVRGARIPANARVQYWYRIWPDNGSGGWQRLDDPLNGQWVDARVRTRKVDGGIEYVFEPLSKEENPKIEREGFGYRHTYKIRLLFDEPAEVSAVEAYNTETVWRSARVRLEWKPNASDPAAFDGQVKARNARIVSVDKEPGGVLVSVDYADNPSRLSSDRGCIIFRNPGWESFSVFVDDVVREGGIYVRDIDALVSDASRRLTYSTWSGPEGKWDATVMEKIASMPEQSLERVMKAIPAKPPVEAHLGVSNMRQEFTIEPSGDLALYAKSLRGPGKDLDRRPWTTDVRYATSTLAEPIFTDGGGRKVTRRLEEGWLPVVISEWSTDEISYAQSSYATMLLEGIGDRENERRGDEPLVLLSKVDIENTSSEQSTAHVWIELSPSVPLAVREDGLIALEVPSDQKPRQGLTPVRGWLDISGRGSVECVDAVSHTLHYRVDLAPGEKHSIYLNVPYIELLDDSELKALASSNYDDRHAEVVNYWKKRIDRGMTYEVPEPVLNDLYKANLWHTLITTDRDPETGLYEHGAATMHYRIYANETGMVAESLEMRGEHEEAMRLEEPFLASQGALPLPGNFQGKDGLLYAAYPDPEKDTYTAQGYNMHHGWALWNICNHYKWTRDRHWLESVAPKLVDACDWITRERQATKVMNPDGTKPVEWGLAPAGDLEDVEEYLYWYATNAYYYVGLKTCADVLNEIGHPEAERLAKDAADYRNDILTSVREAIANAPVVELKDGTWVPYVPQRAYVMTHLKEGWIREGLYPALHLLDADLVEPDSEPVTWLLQDLEDNIFLSKESGYGVEDQLAGFFDFGGFNLQPNLLTNSMAHLRRGETPNFIRVFYNTFWASFYPDIVCFAEWVRHYGQGAGPLYKTPDECKFVNYMRNMLIYEEGDQLRLGTGVPRAWMEDGKSIRITRAATFFGQMDMTIVSHVAQGRIEASITLPTRNPARGGVLKLRHPAGKPMKRVTINGSDWRDFDASAELIPLPAESGKLQVVAYYE